jgi:phytoene desaturase (3,4-didehydrolycopene-forming)
MVGAWDSCTAEQVVCVLIRRLRKYFQDWRIRGLFSFQDLYVGLSPYSAPGVYSLLAGTELTDGVWYPRGGFGKV